MSYDVKDIFERILSICKIKNLKELSIHYGYKENWASSTRKRETIPWDVCLKVSIEYKLSLDYLIFGDCNNEQKINITELDSAVAEGIFSLIQLDMIEPAKGVKISTLTKAITSEINSTLEIKSNMKEIKKAI